MPGYLTLVRDQPTHPAWCQIKHDDPITGGNVCLGEADWDTGVGVMPQIDETGLATVAVLMDRGEVENLTPAEARHLAVLLLITADNAEGATGK